MAEETLKQKTAKGLFWGGISNGVQQVLNLLFGLVLARILDANDYGMVGMLAIFTAIAGTIQESGFTSALTNQKEVRHGDYNAVFWFSTLTGILFYIILFFCAPLIAAFYNRPELVGLSRIVFLGFLFGGVGIASNAYLFKALMVKERAKIDIFALIASGTAGVILALNGFAYTGLAIQTTTYIGIGTLLKLHSAPWRPTFTFSFTPLREMFGFSSKLILTNIFFQFNNHIFSVILGKFYTPAQLGFYAQGQKWMVMGYQFIGGMINGVAQPVLVEVTDDKERQKNIFRKMVRFGAFISFPAMLGLAFVAKEFILILLGEKWLPSVPFLQLSCLWGAVVYLTLLYTNILMTHGKSDLYLYGTIFTGVTQLIAAFVLFPMGIYWMMAGYVACYYFALLLWHYFVNKTNSVTLLCIIKDVAPYLGTTCISFGVAWLATYQLSNIYLVFALKISISILTYYAILSSFNSVILKEAISFLKKR